MKKAVKKSLFSFSIISMLLVVSCLNSDDDYEQRTREMELDELESMLSFLESDGHNIDTSELGIYYVVHEEGEGPLADFGDTLRLEYVGYLIGGQIFDASAYHYEDSIWEFTFEEDKLISGFEDGISLMNEGAELELIIPSDYAYGAEGALYIEPYTTLIFSTKLHDINPAADTGAIGK